MGILLDHMDIFRTSFSSGLAAKLPIIKIKVSKDENTVKL